MRMWNVDPQLLCRKHLLGEHLEMHMFFGAWIRRDMRNLEGYIKNGLVELGNINNRHEQLVKEMERRGMVHVSPLEIINYPNLGKVDVQRSLRELAKRCVDCFGRQGAEGIFFI